VLLLFFASRIAIILFLYLYFYRLAVNKSCSKTSSIAKYKYSKIQRQTFLEDASAMLLLIMICYVTHTVKGLAFLLYWWTLW